MKNKINMFIWWGFLIIYLELIYKLFVVKNLFTINTLSVIVFSIPYIFIFGLITSLFSNKVNRIINIILTIFITILTLAQIVYFNFYHSIFSFFSLVVGGGGQVIQFTSMIIEVIFRIWYIFMIVLLPLILSLIFRKKIFNYNRISIKKILYSLCSIIVSFLLIIININISKGDYSLKKLLYETHAPMLTINKTGLLTMEIIDFYRYFHGFSEEFSTFDINSGSYDKEGYNVLNIDFDSLIDKESDKKVKEMHKFFKNTKPTNKNEYTGLFKDKDIILIIAESFDTIAIDEKLTPTLYKLSNNSFIFNNYYEPLYPISTFDGEFTILTSLIPREGIWSLYEASKNYMPYTYGNMFKNANYNTYAFHNNEFDFYHRDKTHESIGFNYMACGNGLEKLMNCNNWPNSDLEMLDSTKDIYINDNLFATYYMTFSGHLIYNFRENSMSIKNKNVVENTNYSNKIKAYLATNIELDKAVENLVEKLKDENKLDDTLIIITPDHYPYGLTTKHLNEVSSINRDDKFENYHTSLIMYNPNIEKTYIDKVVSGIDLMPTIYNLFDLEYDSRLLMGRDMFSDEEHIVVLSDRSWITDKCSYNSLIGKCSNGFNDKEYIDNINKIVNDRFSISSLIIEKDYYSKLGY